MALVLAFTDDTPSASDATTYTFSTQAIGTAASDRYVLVGITARAAATRTISSVTIAGESATSVVFDGTGNTLAAYYIALVTTGTTGDVVVTFSGAMVRCAIAVYAMTGVDPTPADSATSTADPATANLDIPAGGAAFGLAATGTEPASIAWTNLTADAYLFDTAGYENNNAVGFASDEFASAQTALALTGDFSSATSAPNAAFCSFGPASGGYTLTADAGAYTLAGQDATLLKTRIVTADAGSYAVAGQDASVLVGHLITADAGAYLVAGQDATLTYVPVTPGAYTLTCDAGAYTLAGQDATLLRGRVVTADAGDYLLTGGAATFAYSGGQSQGGGGWLPKMRRKTRKELHAERVRLGILPPDVVKAARKAAAVVLDEPSPVKAYRADPGAANKVFLRELGATKMLPDYTRAIQIQIELMQQEEEEILLLL